MVSHVTNMLSHDITYVMLYIMPLLLILCYFVTLFRYTNSIITKLSHKIIIKRFRCLSRKHLLCIPPFFLLILCLPVYLLYIPKSPRQSKILKKIQKLHQYIMPR